MACWCPGAHAGKAALLVVPPPRHTPPSNSALTLVGPGFFQVHPWLPQPRLFRLFCAANRVLLPGSAPGSLVFCTQRPPAQTEECLGLGASEVLCLLGSSSSIQSDLPTGEETPLGAGTFPPPELPPWGAGPVQIPSFSFSFCLTWLRGGFPVSLEV